MNKLSSVILTIKNIKGEVTCTVDEEGIIRDKYGNIIPDFEALAEKEEEDKDESSSEGS